MGTESPIDIIRFEGEGNSVVVRITGKQSGQSGARIDKLVGEIAVDTAFVRGSTPTWVFLEDLTEWQEALDTLDGGGDIRWRQDKRTVELLVELENEGDRAYVTVADRSMSLTTVKVGVTVNDAWFDDAYDRLDQAFRVLAPDEP
jgi:Family of unknown function (DUF5959)